MSSLSRLTTEVTDDYVNTQRITDVERASGNRFVLFGTRGRANVQHTVTEGYLERQGVLGAAREVISREETDSGDDVTQPDPDPPTDPVTEPTQPPETPTTGPSQQSPVSETGGLSTAQKAAVAAVVGLVGVLLS